MYLVNKMGYEGWINTMIVVETLEKAMECAEAYVKKHNLKKINEEHEWWGKYGLYGISIVEFEIGTPISYYDYEGECDWYVEEDKI